MKNEKAHVHDPAPWSDPAIRPDGIIGFILSMRCRICGEKVDVPVPPEARDLVQSMLDAAEADSHP